MPLPVPSTFLVDYQYLQILWGDLKLSRLIKAENPKDLTASTQRLNVAIDAVQCELLGYFGYSISFAPANILSYVKGIIPVFLEYRLNPHDALKAEVDILIRNMETIHKSITAIVVETGGNDFSMFVV